MTKSDLMDRAFGGLLCPRGMNRKINYLLTYVLELYKLLGEIS